MRPIFQIKADNQDVTEAIQSRLLSLKVVDKCGMSSDTLELQLDDREHQISLPRKGAVLDVHLGYQDEGLISVGAFTVDEVEINGPPSTLTIRAKALDTLTGMKTKKTRSWHQQTLSDIVKTIAEDQQLTPVVGSRLANKFIEHIDQTEESDMNLLSRLAKQYNATAKPVRGKLLFVSHGETKSASGEALERVELSREALSSWRVTLAERNNYPAVQAEWQDLEKGQRRALVVGEGSPLYIIGNSFQNETEAKQAAEAKLKQLKQQGGGGSLTLKPGRPALFAESPILLKGVREGLNGEWMASQVSHSLNNSGLQTQVELQWPIEETSNTE